MLGCCGVLTYALHQLGCMFTSRCAQVPQSWLWSTCCGAPTCQGPAEHLLEVDHQFCHAWVLWYSNLCFAAIWSYIRIVWCTGAAKLAVDNLLRCSNLRIRDLQRTFLKLTMGSGASGHAWVLRTLCGALDTTRQAMTEASEYFDMLAHCINQVQRQPVEVSDH